MFMFDLISGNAVTNASYETSPDPYAIADGTTVTKTYNNTTGIITVSGGQTQGIRTISGSSTKVSGTQTFQYNVYFCGNNKVNLGNQITNINISNIGGYQSFTVDNFLIDLISIPSTSTRGYSPTQSGCGGFTVTKNYNPSTGDFSVSGMSQTIRGGHNGSITATQSFNYNVWLVW